MEHEVLTSSEQWQVVTALTSAASDCEKHVAEMRTYAAQLRSGEVVPSREVGPNAIALWADGEAGAKAAEHVAARMASASDDYRQLADQFESADQIRLGYDDEAVDPHLHCPAPRGGCDAGLDSECPHVAVPVNAAGGNLADHLVAFTEWLEAQGHLNLCPGPHTPSTLARDYTEAWGDA